MPFNASVNLGTIGNGITGQTVSISGCTGASCGSGCTSLTTSQAVSSFPKTITGIPDNVVSLFVRVDGGDCSGTSQCISITGIPGATPTPTTTPTINPTITPTTTPTINPTITPTTTTTPTINPTITPTTTPTAGNCQINGTAFVNVSNPTATGQIVLQTTGRIMNVSVFGGATSGGSNSVTLTVTGSGLTPTPSPNSVTISANAFATNTGTLVLPVTGTYNYTITMTPNGSSGHSASFECGNQFISTPTPTITSTPTYNFYRAGEVLQSNLSTTYCSQQGYLISGELYSATPYASITPGSTLLYTDYGLTQLFTGGGVGYIVAISDIADVNTNSGTIKYIQVDGQGNILTLGTFNCSGGGGFNQV